MRVLHSSFGSDGTHSGEGCFVVVNAMSLRLLLDTILVVGKRLRDVLLGDLRA